VTDQNSALSAAYGDIFRILKQTHYRKLSVFTIDANITPPIRLGQYHLIHNDRGIPMAYATWAFLSSDNIEMMKSGDDRPLHISEWNEGTHLFINGFIRLMSIFMR
jgi:cytolysin-activating lysine-acyltransferase